MNISKTLKDFAAWTRDRFFLGLCVAIPIALTVWIVNLLYSLINGPLDQVIRHLISEHHLPASEYFKTHYDGTIPGAGFLLTLLLLVLIGVLTGNYVGKKLLGFIDLLFGRVPVVRPIYNAIKQAVEAVQNLSGDDKNATFNQVVYIPYPGTKTQVLGFVTSRFTRPDGTLWCHVFLPNAPSPLAGFVLIVPESELVLADITVEQATKIILSCGLVTPNSLGR